MARKEYEHLFPATAQHMNGHLPCAIDVSTTGANPKINDLLEVAIIPLNPDWTIHAELPIFDMKIKPQRVEFWEDTRTLAGRVKIQESIRSGVEASLAADLFEEWFKSLKLPEYKKIIPVGFNYSALDRPFLMEWLGHSTYELFVHFRVRDVMRAVAFVNDRCDMLSMAIPFPKYGLGSIAGRLGVKYQKMDSKTDAAIAAECYRRLLKMSAF